MIKAGWLTRDGDAVTHDHLAAQIWINLLTLFIFPSFQLKHENVLAVFLYCNAA